MERKRDYRATYQALFEVESPNATQYETSQAGILARGRGFMSAFDFTMQLQVGCPGGCLFCYVPAADQLTPADVKGEQGRNWGFLVRNKENVLHKFKRHLYRAELADKTIYWSGVTDPYAAPPIVTRGLWQILNSAPPELRPRRIAIQTRFRPDRDAGLVQRYNQTTRPTDGGPPVLVSFSVGTDRNDLIAAWEKSTPLFEKRLAAIRALRQAGLFVVATLSPFGLWHDLAGTLAQFKHWGVAYITCLFFKEQTPSANTPPLFLDYLRQNYPMLLEPSWQRERLYEMCRVYGEDGVFVGRAGFETLACPHRLSDNVVYLV